MAEFKLTVRVSWWIYPTLWLLQLAAVHRLVRAGRAHMLARKVLPYAIRVNGKRISDWGKKEACAA